jgi:lipopolysaccharide export system permease protein
MKILDKYLIKEIVGSTLSVFGIFMIILSANTMLRLIEEASLGNFPSYLLFPIIVIKITQYSIYIIPISLFFGIILSLGRFYNSNEMAVISASGQSPKDLAKIISNVIFPAALLVSLFSLYITPSATEYRYKLEHRLNSEERIEEIKPGRFASSQNGRATFFVENINRGHLNKIFFSSIGSEINTIENSVSATYYIDESDRKFLLMKEGIINEVISSIDSITRKTKYEEHGIQLGQDIPKFYNKKFDSMSTIELFNNEEIESSAELQYRLLLPIATLLLGFIAIPLSYSSPRKGRYNKIFSGAMIYFTYFILISVAKKLYLLNHTPVFFGTWWVHVMVAIIILFIYINDMNKIPNRS